jgi:hypothetical protein
MYVYIYIYLFIYIIIAPLVYVDPNDKDRTATVFGIVSWNGACAYDEWPDVYARVDDTGILSWIEKITGTQSF